MRQPYVVPRRRLFFAVWLTVMALPILGIYNISRTDGSAAPVTAAGADAPDPPASPLSAPPSSETTTSAALANEATAAAPPSTAAQQPSTTAPRAPSARAKAPAAPAPSTTTTTEPPATTPANEQHGAASWYAYNPGECAHPTIPKGTAVTVTLIATGASATCVVTDRGPHGGGRIIDLDRGTFAQLANPGSGVVEVRITW